MNLKSDSGKSALNVIIASQALGNQTEDDRGNKYDKKD